MVHEPWEEKLTVAQGKKIGVRIPRTSDIQKLGLCQKNGEADALGPFYIRVMHVLLGKRTFHFAGEASRNLCLPSLLDGFVRRDALRLLLEKHHHAALRKQEVAFHGIIVPPRRSPRALLRGCCQEAMPLRAFFKRTFGLPELQTAKLAVC